MLVTPFPNRSPVVLDGGKVGSNDSLIVDHLLTATGGGGTGLHYCYSNHCSSFSWILLKGLGNCRHCDVKPLDGLIPTTIPILIFKMKG